MVRKKKREKICTTVEKALIGGLRELSEETRINLNLLLDEAIADLLRKYGKAAPGE